MSIRIRLTPTNPLQSGGSKGSLYSQGQGDSTRVILVFFIGGCTFAEISALRFLSQQEELNVEFIVATTKLINGNSFLKSIMEPLMPDN